MKILLVSTYEMGRQPFGLASPSAWLREAGHDVNCVDLSRQPFNSQAASADFIGFYLPMHTATRLAVPVIRKIRKLNPKARICCYGLYAPMNESVLKSVGVDHVLGGEFESDLTRLADGDEQKQLHLPAPVILPRLKFKVPDRNGLLSPARYASLHHSGALKTAGYTESSRGCRHHCRHCPIVPVYNGQFRIVPVEVVLEDIRQQVDLGVEHVTFGDPDFFNGVGHALRLVEEMSRQFPDLTYDVTIKIEHLLQQSKHLAQLRSTGCIFVTSAVESFDDRVLAVLQKGHTADDVRTAVEACRRVDLPLIPTFVAFTPWTTLDSYSSFLESIFELGLVEHVSPIQLAISLLVPQGSRLLDLPEVTDCLDPFDPVRLVYPWRNPDEKVNQLAEEVVDIVGTSLNSSRAGVFSAVWEATHRSAKSFTAQPFSTDLVARASVPFLNEPWYC